MRHISAYIQSDDDHSDIELVIKSALQNAIQNENLNIEGRTAVGVQLMNDTDIQQLNKTYRGKDKPTNILSFPDGETVEDGELYLGDLAISIPTMEKEAKELGISIEHHMTHLSIHGLLHLLGFDHEEDEEAEEMESLEIAILAQLDIKNPYEDQKDCGRLKS